MKKTLIATAIAGAMSFSVAAQAAPTVYGNIQLKVDMTDDMYAADNGSTIGFKGEEAMENGLTAIYGAEFHFKAGTRDGNETVDADGDGENDQLQATGISGSDHNYLGVKGSFGKVRVGAFDTVANDFVADMVFGADAVDIRQGAGIVGGEDQQVQYTGDFGMLTVGASVQLNEGTAATEAQKQVMQFGVKAAVAEGITASAAMSTEDGLGAGVKAAMDALTVGASFETSDSVDTALNVSAAFDYGMGTAYGVFAMKDTGTTDGSDIAFGANYSVTESLYVYGEYGDGDFTDANTVVGAVMSF